MFAIRDDREYINQEDLTKAARKVAEAKKHESEYISLYLFLCPIELTFVSLLSETGIFSIDARNVFTSSFTMHFYPNEDASACCATSLVAAKDCPCS